MGREKHRLEEGCDRGWFSLTDALVCNSCVGDPFLSAYITANGKSAVCDYCGLDPEEDADSRCIPFDDLMDLIGDGVTAFYKSADDEGIPYESAEGGYAFPEQMFDTYDLLTEEICLDVEPAVFDDVKQALLEQTWCKKDFWSLSLGDALRSGWAEFVRKVKYETRYLFTLPQPQRPVATPTTAVPVEPLTDANREFTGRFDALPVGDPEFGIDYDDEDGIPVSEMLDAIGRLVSRLDLIQEIPAGKEILRVRVVGKGCELVGPVDLGPPPRERATQTNRMSPPGIVMFYGAFDRETALAETFQPYRDGATQKNVWVATFELLKQLRVVDLTRLPPTPSIFDAASRDLLPGVTFLRDFVDDFVAPISRDGREHIEYVPTQIVTEFVRYRLRTKDDENVHGILYRSSKHDKGIA